MFLNDSKTAIPFYQQVGECTFQFLPYLQSVDIEKPQSHFQTHPVNSSANFVPLLREKHNAKSEFKLTGCDVLPNCFILEDYSRQIGIDLVNQELHGYLNPYTYEINRFSLFVAFYSLDVCYPDFADQKPDQLVQPSPFNPANCLRIDTESTLEDLIASLLHEPCFAFSLREHSFHSYLGFTCVIAVFSSTLCDVDLDGRPRLRDRRAFSARLAVATQRSVQS